jgi:hypothetical protein
MNVALHDLFGLHALYALEPDLADHLEAQEIHAWHHETVSILARTIPLHRPPPAVKVKLLARIRRDTHFVRVRRWDANARTGRANA